MQPVTMNLQDPNPRTEQSIVTSPSRFVGVPIDTIFSYTSVGVSITVKLEGRQVTPLSFQPDVTKAEIEAAFESWLPPTPSLPRGLVSPLSSPREESTVTIKPPRLNLYEIQLIPSKKTKDGATKSATLQTSIIGAIQHYSPSNTVIVKRQGAEPLSIPKGSSEEAIVTLVQSWLPQLPLKSITIYLSDKNPSLSQKFRVTEGRIKSTKEATPLAFIEEQTLKGLSVVVYLERHVPGREIKAGATQTQFKRPLESWLSSLSSKERPHDFSTLVFYQHFPGEVTPLELDRPTSFKKFSPLLLLPAVIALLYWQREPIQAWLSKP